MITHFKGFVLWSRRAMFASYVFVTEGIKSWCLLAVVDCQPATNIKDGDQVFENAILKLSVVLWSGCWSLVTQISI